MEKIKWKYDKKRKQWWANETAPWSNDGYQICHDLDGYVLTGYELRSKLYFKKISSAKTVANLLRHG